MTTGPIPDRPIRLRPAPDGRPPALVVFGLEAEPVDSHPMLPFEDHPAGHVEPGPDGSAAALRDRAPHGRPADRAGVVDGGVEAWCGTLAVAVFEALRGRRPVGQLTRWVDERVIAVIAHHRRHAGVAPPGRPVALRSVRVQHPRRGVAEVSAHVGVPGRSAAIALRLETWGDRWLCTAIAFDPRVGRGPAQTLGQPREGREPGQPPGQPREGRESGQPGDAR